MKRKELLDAISKLYPTITTNPIAEEMSFFKFDEGFLSASDGITWIRVKAPSDMKLNCLVPAQKLYKLISSMTAEEVDLSLKETSDEEGELKIKAGKSIATYKVPLEGGVLDDLDFDVDGWYDVPEDMIVGLRKTKFAASTDASRGVLCGVLLDDQDIIAADGQRIARFRSSEALTEDGERIVLSMNLVNLLGNYKGLNEWTVEDDTAYFRSEDGTIIAGRTIDGDYPNAKEWLLQAKDAEGSVAFPKGAAESLKRHLDQQIDVSPMDKEVLVTFGGKSLKLASTDEEHSYTLDETLMLGEKVGQEIEFGIHPEFLLDILGSTTTMRFSTKEETKFIVFDDKSFTYMATVDTGNEEEEEEEDNEDEDNREDYDEEVEE